MPNELPMPTIAKTEEVCSLCKFASTIIQRPGAFLCRRFPPVPTFTGSQVQPLYSMVNGGDTCGEFKRKILQ